MKLLTEFVELLEGLWFCRLLAVVWFIFALRFLHDHDLMFGLLALTVTGHHLRELGLLKKTLKK